MVYNGHIECHLHTGVTSSAVHASTVQKLSELQVSFYRFVIFDENPKLVCSMWLHKTGKKII